MWCNNIQPKKQGNKKSRRVGVRGPQNLKKGDKIYKNNKKSWKNNANLHATPFRLLNEICKCNYFASKDQEAQMNGDFATYSFE